MSERNDITFEIGLGRHWYARRFWSFNRFMQQAVIFRSEESTKSGRSGKKFSGIFDRNYIAMAVRVIHFGAQSMTFVEFL